MNDDAFRQLVEPHLAKAYRIACLILLDRELARDAVQEALIRAYRSWPRFRPGESAGPWLNRIVVNEARRMLGRSRRQPALLGEVPSLVGPVEDSPEYAALAREEREQLWRAIAGLGELQRTVLVLRYYQQMSEDEMAAVLDVSPGTVKSRLHNARKQLEQRLRGEPPEGGLLKHLWGRMRNA